METGNAKHAIHLIDLTADHYFGERQLLVEVRADSKWLRSAIFNLLLNACLINGLGVEYLAQGALFPMML
jgi:signal transduction histidine kinase